MNLKNKLAVNSTLLFAFIVGLLMAGSFLLFRSHMKDLYFDNLEDHAMTTALFYFEKDEIKNLTANVTNKLNFSTSVSTTNRFGFMMPKQINFI